MAGERSQQWTKAKRAEDESLEESDAWEKSQREDIQKSVKITQAKRAFDARRRSDGAIKRRKARLAARGDLQDPTTYSDAYAGAANKRVALLMLSLASYCDYEVASRDASTALLRGELEEGLSRSSEELARPSSTHSHKAHFARIHFWILLRTNTIKSSHKNPNTHNIYNLHHYIG